MSSQAVIASGVTEKTLTHEVGAGAPCLKCGDKCPGLDLHFWRKICRNCKCSQDTHDVNSSVSAKGIDNIGKLLQKDVTENHSQPPPEKTESPKRSPEKKTQKISIINEPPPPAPKPTKHTSTVTHVIKPTKPSSPEPPFNGSAPYKEGSPHKETYQNKESTPLQDSGFVKVDIGGKQHTLDFGIPLLVDNFPAPPPESQDPHNDFPAPPPPLVEEVPPEIPPLPAEFQEKVVIKGEPAAIPPPITSKESPKKIVQSSSSDDSSSESKDDSTPSATIKKKYDLDDDDDDDELSSLSSDDEVEYEWNPPVADKNLVEVYIDALPENKRPIVGTEGAKYRKKQLMRQLPAHDQEPNECHDLTSQEKYDMQLFVKQYRENALGEAKIEEGSKPKSCAECREALKVGDAVIYAERAGSEKRWHPACFVCEHCKELLVDLIYFYNEDKIYCGRHYCELHKPRCAACDELIFAPEYTQAEESYWHLKHFCCWHCDQPLGGKNYVPHDNQPVCIPCYEKTFAHTCSTCKDIIAPNTEWVTFESNHWHADDNCFKCTQCDQSLVGKPCIPKGDMVFCSSKCKREKLAPQ